VVKFAPGSTPNHRADPVCRAEYGVERNVVNGLTTATCGICLSDVNHRRSQNLLSAALRYGFLFGLCLAGREAVPADVPGGGDDGPNVTINRQGGRVTLANGIITAVIDTASAKVVSLRYQGHEMISQTGRHKTIYFFVVGNKDYEIANPCVFSVKRQTPDLVDISCKRVYSRPFGKRNVVSSG
jgi:hypothetical protein